MKKNLTWAFLVFLLMGSCLKEDIKVTNLSSNRSIDRLGGKDLAVLDGILSFKDNETFQSVTKELSLKSPAELDIWERQLGFKSLRSLHMRVSQEEEKFLNKMAEKYPGNTTMTRKELGFSDLTMLYLKEDLMFINEYETIDMNVTSPLDGTVANEHGVFRIGEDVIMPKLKSYKVLKGGDLSKMAQFNSATLTNKDLGILIYKVKRESGSKYLTTGRTNTTLSFCDNIYGSYRLIVYENITQVLNEIDYPCDNAPANYWLRLSSLKSFLGTWQDHATNQWTFVAYTKADHVKACPNEGLTVVRNIVNIDGVQYYAPFTATWERYFFTNYDLGPCASGQCPDGRWVYGDTNFPIGRSFLCYGKGGTYCYVGS